MMKRLSLVLSTILLVVIGVSCSSLAYTPIPTPNPPDDIPAIISLTVQAGQIPVSTPTPASVLDDTHLAPPTSTAQENTSTTGPSPTYLEFNPSPTSSPIPSATSTIDVSATPSRRSTRTPTITPTPTTPNAGVQISEPGPMSKVSSPLKIVANLRSIPSGSYLIEIWAEPLHPGEDARRLYGELQNLISNPVPWVFLDQQIEFELSRVSEFGQLRVSIFDQYGRPFSINSVDLILLSMGASEITPKGDLTEPIIIREPTPNQLIQGGMLIVSGLAKPTEEFMLIELVAADGSVVGYRQVFVTPAADGSYIPFAIEVPYTVSVPTWVRLRISESGTRIPGIERLSSVELLVSP